MLIFENHRVMNESSNVFTGTLGKAAKNSPKKEKDALAKLLREKGVDLGRSSSDIVMVKNGKDPVLSDPDCIIFGVIHLKTLLGKEQDEYHMVVVDGSTNGTVIDYELPRNYDRALICSDGTRINCNDIRNKKFSSMSWNLWVKYVETFYVLRISQNPASEDIAARRKAEKQGSDMDYWSPNYRATDLGSMRPSNRSGYDKSGYHKGSRDLKQRLMDKKWGDYKSIKKFADGVDERASKALHSLVDETIKELNDGIRGLGGYSASNRISRIIQELGRFKAVVTPGLLNRIKEIEDIPEENRTESQKSSLESAINQVQNYSEYLDKAIRGS